MQSEGGYMVTATRGLGMSLYRTRTYGSRSFAVGFNLLDDFTPDTGYHAIVPAWVELPPKVGNVEPAVAIILTDGTYAIHGNPTAETLKVATAFEAASDGQSVGIARFQAWNHGTVAETQDLGIFKFQGWQF